MTATIVVVASICGIAAFLFWNARPVVWHPKAVADILEGLLNGELESGEWDYFISVKIKNPKLELVRNEMGKVWCKDSDYMEVGKIDPCCLNSKGREKVTALLKKCRELESEADAT